MREKLLWAAVLILGAMIATSRAQTQSSAKAAVPDGRYQLVVGPSLSGDPSAGLYRIDTLTGKTWIKGLRLEANCGQSDLWFLIEEPKIERSIP